MEEENSLLNPEEKKRQTRRIIFISAIVVILLLGIIVPVIVFAAKNKPRNLIILISDGCGPTSYSFARQMKGSPLTIDSILVGTVETSSSDSLITDSAAGATAYTCAKRTYNGAIAVTDDKKPCGTLMEAAREKGMKTGLVATSRITHATPASFSAHATHRDMEDYIAEQQVTRTKVDVMFGGGLRHFKQRADKIDLLKKAQDEGYHTLTSVEEFSQKLKLPTLGLFANSHMDYEIDRDPKKQPSLAEMTQKALDLLYPSKKGFILMVEGSRIDMAAHGNDPGAHYHDLIAYDETVKVILDFVKKHPETTVVGFSDHETGGLTLGRNFNNNTYPTYEWHPKVIHRQKISTEAMAGQIILEGESVEEVFKTYADIEDLSDEEIFKLENTTDMTILGSFIGDMISYRARVGWTTWGHTAADINLYAAGDSSSIFKGHFTNNHIGEMLANMFKFNLEKETKALEGFNPISPYETVSTRDHESHYHD